MDVGCEFVVRVNIIRHLKRLAIVRGQICGKICIEMHLGRQFAVGRVLFANLREVMHHHAFGAPLVPVCILIHSQLSLCQFGNRYKVCPFLTVRKQICGQDSSRRFAFRFSVSKAGIIWHKDILPAPF